MKTTAYLEHNNGGKTILYNYNGKWWYEEVDTTGFFGDVDLYEANQYGEYISDELIAEELRKQYMIWEFLDSDFFTEESEHYVPEYDNMSIDDIDNKCNYNPDGTPKGHDEIYWTKICEIDVE